MKHVRTKAVALAVAGGVAALTLAGVPALAASHSKSVTGPELITGVVHGAKALANSPHIPLRLAGVVTTTDPNFVLGNGKSKSHVLKTGAGDFAVVSSAKPEQSEQVNTKTCHLSFTENLPLQLVPSKSTGKFAGASGPAAVQVSFAAFVHRYTSGKHKGECNFNGAAVKNKPATARFLGSAVITVDK